MNYVSNKNNHCDSSSDEEELLWLFYPRMFINYSLVLSSLSKITLVLFYPSRVLERWAVRLLVTLPYASRLSIIRVNSFIIYSIRFIISSYSISYGGGWGLPSNRFNTLSVYGYCYCYWLFCNWNRKYYTSYFSKEITYPYFFTLYCSRMQSGQPESLFL